MKIKAMFCVLAGLGALLTSCATDPAVTRVQMSSTGGSDSSISGGVLKAVNSYRSSQGLSSLRRHTGLDRLAQEHANFMMQNRGSFSLHGKNVTHYGFGGRVAAAQHHHNMETISENVIAGTRINGDVASVLVRGWANSGGHRSNMTEDWSVTGIGVAVAEDGSVFAAQLFGTPNLTHSRWAGPSQQF